MYTPIIDGKGLNARRRFSFPPKLAGLLKIITKNSTELKEYRNDSAVECELLNDPLVSSVF